MKRNLSRIDLQMHLESILLRQKTVSSSRNQCYYIIVNHMDVVPMIFQSKEKLGSKQQEFPFTSIEMFRAECLQRIRIVKKSL